MKIQTDSGKKQRRYVNRIRTAAPALFAVALMAASIAPVQAHKDVADEYPQSL